MSAEATPSSWPPSSGLCSPTVPRKDAVFQTSAGPTIIRAPASRVFEAVIKVDDYPKWNSFVPRVHTIEQPGEDSSDISHIRIGTIMKFDVIMDSKKPNKPTETQLQVADISTPDQPTDYVDAETLNEDPAYTADLSQVYRVSWKQHGGFASRGLKTERFHEIIIKGENECELRTWEVYGGMLAHTVKWMYQKTLDDKFRLWGDDLKKYCEENSSSSS